MKRLIYILAIMAMAIIALAVSAPFGPTVVAKYAATGQTASIGSTTLFTPSEDGDYELSIYISSDSNNGGNASVFVIWVDENRSHNFNSASVSGSMGNETGSAATVIHATAGNPIQFSISYSAGTPPSIAYDVFITLVKK